MIHFGWFLADTERTFGARERKDFAGELARAGSEIHQQLLVVAGNATDITARTTPAYLLLDHSQSMSGIPGS